MEVSSVEEVVALMRARGERITSSRRALLEVLFHAEGPLTVEEIEDSIRAVLTDVNISTVYRNLEDLERMGVVVHCHVGHGPAAYHLSSFDHTHFVCEECGAMIEAPDELIRGLEREVKAKLGFSIDAHHFPILGRCSACSCGATEAGSVKRAATSKSRGS
jgi:Fe2+ or Zn2+ uptake regulation protein